MLRGFMAASLLGQRASTIRTKRAKRQVSPLKAEQLEQRTMLASDAMAKFELFDVADNPVATFTEGESNMGTVSVDPSAFRIEEGASAAFNVRLSAISSTDTVIEYTLTGTATNGDDYTQLSGTITILANTRVTSIPLDTIDDSDPEDQETVIITLTGVTEGNPGIQIDTDNDTASIDIADNDTPLARVSSFTMGDEEQAEPGSFTLSQTVATEVDTVITYSLMGTATEGADYNIQPTPAVTRTAVIPADSQSVTITLAVIDDDLVENNETVTLRIESISGDSQLEIDPNQRSGTLTIIDNDRAEVSVAATIPTANEAGTTAGEVTFSLTKKSATDTIIAFSTDSPSTARPSEDYVSIGNSVTIPAGELSASLSIVGLPDNLPEGPETVVVIIDSVTEGLVNVSVDVDNREATVTILDDGSGNCLLTLDGPLIVGVNRVVYSCPTAGSLSAFVIGTEFGSFTYERYNQTVDIANPQVSALGVANQQGVAVALVAIPAAMANSQILLQAFEMVPGSQISNVLVANVGSVPLLAEGGQGSGGAAISSSQVAAVFAEAKQRWKATNLSAAELARLDSAQFQVLDLPNALVGSALRTTVFLDTNAAGHGWFVDSTPSDDSEFELAVGTHERIATTGSAQDRIDLLTVIMHELGHVLGHSDESHSTGEAQLMDFSLPQSTRRLASDLPASDRTQPLQNRDFSLDVDGDGRATLSDALQIVSQLRGQGSRRVGDILRQQGLRNTLQFDVSGDNLVSLQDALLIVAHLRNSRFIAGEGEAAIGSTSGSTTAAIAQKSSALEPISEGEASQYEATIDAVLASYATEDWH